MGKEYGASAQAELLFQCAVLLWTQNTKGFVLGRSSKLMLWWSWSPAETNKQTNKKVQTQATAGLGFESFPFWERLPSFWLNLGQGKTKKALLEPWSWTRHHAEANTLPHLFTNEHPTSNRGKPGNTNPVSHWASTFPCFWRCFGRYVGGCQACSVADQRWQYSFRWGSAKVLCKSTG